jgi:hypothetical protein
VRDISGDAFPADYSGTTTTSGGNTYWLHPISQTLTLGSNDQLNAKNIEGFTYSFSDNEGGTKIYTDYWNYYWIYSTYNFYYTRNEYTFAYNSQTSAYSGGSVSNVPFEKSLSLVFPGHTSDWTGRTITVDGVTKVFGGGYYEPECENVVDFATARMPAKDLTVYAKWVKQQVKLMFDSASSGQAISDRDYYVGDVVENLPVLADQNNMEFTGWYSDPETTQRFTDGMTISRNTTLYAGWKQSVTKYTVKYVNQNNSLMSTSKVVLYVAVGTVITAGNTTGVTESPAYVPGYTFDSVDPASLTLVKDSSQNTIVFRYVPSLGTITRSSTCWRAERRFRAFRISRWTPPTPAWSSITCRSRTTIR